VTGDRACRTCNWPVPAYVPDYLVSAAMGDHRANDCVPEPAGETREVVPRAAGDGTQVPAAAAFIGGEVPS
jgi:hypothetical protein